MKEEEPWELYLALNFGTLCQTPHAVSFLKQEDTPWFTELRAPESRS